MESPTVAEIPKFYSFICPISQNVMEDPVIAQDGFTYDRSSIMSWFETRTNSRQAITSPMTREIISIDLIPNIALKNALEELRKEYIKSPTGTANPTSPSSNFDFFSFLGVDVSAELTGHVKAMSSEVFVELDKIAHLDLMANLDLKPPQIVVLGMESHGKSTLLERLIGFPIFPRNAEFCTRCPIRVVLRRQTVASFGKLNARHPTTNEELPSVPLPKVFLRRTDRTGNEPQSSDEAYRPTEVAMQDISAYVKRQMDVMVGNETGKTIISDREIVIEIRTPYCPNIDLLDLPGIVTIPKAPAEASLSLAKRVIANEKEYSVFLLVVAGKCNLSQAATLVEEMGIANKTIGVFTRMDEYIAPNAANGGTKEEGFRRHLETDNIALSHPWLGCASVPLSDVYDGNGVMRLATWEQKEIRLLSSEYSDLRREKRVGMPAIRSTVQMKFEEFICNQWVVKLAKAMKMRFLNLSDENANMGLPIPIDPSFTNYDRALGDIQALVPHVYPEYKLSMLPLCDAHTIHSLFIERVKVVCRNEKWAEFDIWSIWAQELLQYSKHTAQEAALTSPAVYSKSEDIMMSVAQMKKNQLSHLVYELNRSSQSKTNGLRNCLMHAVLDLNKSDFQGFHNALKFDFATVSEVDKAYCTKLYRFTAFIKDYEQYMDDKIETNLKQFTELSKTFIASIDPEQILEREYSQTDGTVMTTFTFHPNVSKYPHRIISLWTKHVMGNIVKDTESWQLPEGPLKEHRRVQREKTLKEMADLASGLNALMMLMERVSAERR